MCPDIQDLREAIEQDIHSLINSSVLSLRWGLGQGMELVTVVVLDGGELPISICLIQHRLAADLRIIQLCSLATQGIQYSQICGRIIGYQVCEP